MTNLSPKVTFLRFHPVLAEQLKAARESDVVVIPLTYSLAEMANLGATAEQINGARNLINIFQNLWDKGEPMRRLPVTELTSYEVSPEDLAALAGQPVDKKPTTKK